MNFPLLKFVVLLLGVWAAESRELMGGIVPVSVRHEQWMARYGRVYKNAAEKQHRLGVFRANLELVETFNAAGKNKYKLGTNQFADLTNQEFKTIYNGLRPSVPNTGTSSFRYENTTAAPSSIDWRSKGAVTPVKNQGQCGEHILIPAG